MQGDVQVGVQNTVTIEGGVWWGLNQAPNPNPEPGSWILLAIGFGAVALFAAGTYCIPAVTRLSRSRLPSGNLTFGVIDAWRTIELHRGTSARSWLFGPSESNVRGHRSASGTYSEKGRTSASSVEPG